MNPEPQRVASIPTDRENGLENVPALDQVRFDHLMDIAGPDHARELLRRLRLDLESVQDKLLSAQSPTDPEQLHSQTHVLIALAGAVGAVRLQHTAEAVSMLARHRDVAGASRLMPGLLEDLDTLIDFVSERLAGMGG